MCDEFTEADNRRQLEQRLSRRELGVHAGVAFAALVTGCGPASSEAHAPVSSGEAPSQTPPAGSSAGPDSVPHDSVPHDSAPLDSAGPPAGATAPSAAPSGRMVTIPMTQIPTSQPPMTQSPLPASDAEAFFVAPGEGRHPGVLIWPDVAGLRDAYRALATRLAGEGYAVLVVNPYYRAARLPVLTSFAEWQTEAGKEKIRPLREALTPERISQDGADFVAWLDRQPQVDPTKKIAVAGYCMGGPFTFRTAGAAPERVGVIASFHGGGLVTSEQTSPHLLLSRLKVAALICIAENDDAREPAAKTSLREAAARAAIPAEIEVYPALHGWCTPDSPAYDHAQAERAWARLLVTLREHA